MSLFNLADASQAAEKANPQAKGLRYISRKRLTGGSQGSEVSGVKASVGSFRTESLRRSR